MAALHVVSFGTCEEVALVILAFRRAGGMLSRMNPRSFLPVQWSSSAMSSAVIMTPLCSVEIDLKTLRAEVHQGSKVDRETAEPACG